MWRINFFLKMGLIYTEAVILENIPGIIGKELWNSNEKFFIEFKVLIDSKIWISFVKSALVSIFSSSIFKKHSNKSMHRTFPQKTTLWQYLKFSKNGEQDVSKIKSIIDSIGKFEFIENENELKLLCYK